MKQKKDKKCLKFIFSSDTNSLFSFFYFIIKGIGLNLRGLHHDVLLFHVDNHIILIIHAIIIRYLTLKHFFSLGDDAFNLGRDVFLILTITVLWFRLLRIQYNLYIHEMVLLAELETSAEFSFKLQILWTIIFDFDINKKLPLISSVPNLCGVFSEKHH